MTKPLPRETLQIRCNDKEGILTLRVARVMCAGHLPLPITQFAWLAGSRDWLRECRVAQDGEPEGLALGEWLARHSLAIIDDALMWPAPSAEAAHAAHPEAAAQAPPPQPPAQPASPMAAEQPAEQHIVAEPPRAVPQPSVLQPGAEPLALQPPEMQPPSPPPAAAKPPPSMPGSKRQGKRSSVSPTAPSHPKPPKPPKPPANTNSAVGREPTVEAMRAHLDGVFIGLKPGDATGGELPAELPPPRLPVSPGAAVIRVGELSYAQLMAASAASLTTDPFACLLSDPPGAPPARLGHITGQNPARRAAATAAAEEEEQGAAASNGHVSGSAGAAAVTAAVAVEDDAAVAMSLG